MDIIGQGFNSRWKGLFIHHNISFLVPVPLPAVVNNNILVSCIFHTAFDHGIGHFTDHRLINAASILIPAVPAHGRSLGQLIKLLRESSLKNDQE